MLLQALMACTWVTLRAVAISTGVTVRSSAVKAEGDLDFRGTLGVDKTAPVGFQDIRLRFELETDADPNTVATPVKLTERNCVVLQTIRVAPPVHVSVQAGPATVDQ